MIHKGSIVCGKSAKSERNQISAIRRALFEFDDHRREVVAYFRSVAPCSVMVIATSDNMALKILKKLDLPAPEQIVHIEDVATPEEIVKARRERFGKGQHVIPVSHVLVRKILLESSLGSFAYSGNRRTSTRARRPSYARRSAFTAKCI